MSANEAIGTDAAAAGGFLRVPEAARRIGVSRRTALRAIKDGIPGPNGAPVRLAAVRVGRWFRVPAAAVAVFLSHFGATPTPNGPAIADAAGRPVRVAATRV